MSAGSGCSRLEPATDQPHNRLSTMIGAADRERTPVSRAAITERAGGIGIVVDPGRTPGLEDDRARGSVLEAGRLPTGNVLRRLPQAATTVSVPSGS